VTVPPYGEVTAGTDIPTCYRHPGRETWVRCTRCNRPICPDCMRDAAVGFQCPDCVSAGQRSVRPPRTAFGGKVAARPGTVTMLLIAANAAIFVLTVASGAGLMGDGPSPVSHDLAMIPAAVAAGAYYSYYRLLTSMFLHFGVVHIGVNMYALYLLGMQVETALGRLRFITLYLLAGLGGAAASYLFSPVATPSGGASGAIFGLLAAYFVLARRVGADTRQILAWIGINLVLSFSLSRIDYRAHLGGLVVGAAVTAALVYAPIGRSRTAVQLAGMIAAAVLIIVAVGVRTAQLA
jgi:membrane associated rhomboid family serine protease